MNWLRIFQTKADVKSFLIRSASDLYGFDYQSLRPNLSEIRNIISLAFYVRRQSKKYTAVGSGYRGMKFNTSLGNRSFVDVAPRGDEAPTPAYQVLYDARLLSGHDSRRFEDMITGVRAGAKFSIVEAKLVSTLERGSPLAFQGLLFHIKFPGHFSGRTIVARSGWYKQGEQKEGLSKVGLVSTELERAFSVYSTDQVEARTILSPDRLERLVALERHFAGQGLRGIIEGGQMMIALEATNQFEGGGVWPPLVDKTRFASTLHELGLVCDVIDGLMTHDWQNQPQR